MNDFFKYGLCLLAGVAVGAIGATAINKGNIQFKPLMSDLLSCGMNIKDNVLGKIETVKENIADTVAEARQKADKEQTENVANS